MQEVEINGEKVQVYIAAEHTAGVDAAKAAAEGEWKPKLTTAEADLKAAKEAAAQRSAEFGAFRKLSEEQVKQLSEKDGIIYRNQELLEKNRTDAEAAAKVSRDNAIAAAIRSKVGTNEKLYTETRKMYDLLGMDDNSADGITKRATAALGALGSTEPDLLASAGFAGGSYAPPVAPSPSGNSFADTDNGKALAKELGLITEASNQ